MAKKLLPSVPENLFPVVCTCQNHECKQKYEVTEISDFSIKKLYGADREEPVGSEEIVVICDICGDYAFPPDSKKQALITTFKVWKKTGKSTASKVWSKDFTCPECKTTSAITLKNLRMGTTADSANYGGETPTYEVHIVCPVCESHIKAHGQVPSGIENKIRSEFRDATKD